MIKNTISIALFLFAAAQAAPAGSAPGILSVVKADTVYLYLTEPPRIGQAFHVDRKGPSDKDWVRLTQAPVSAVLDPNRAVSVIGDDFRFILQSLKAESPEAMLLNLRTDRLAGMAYMMIYPRVAEVLGRFYKAGGNEKGSKVSFRFVMVDRKGKEVQSFKKEVLIQEQPPVPPQSLACVQEKRIVRATWRYPKWTSGAGDMAVQFNLYRKSSKSKYQKINRSILLRLEGVALEYVDEEAAEAGEYTYYLAAADPAGVESRPSNEVVVAMKDLFPPQSPLGLFTQASGARVELIWNMNPEPDVAHYNVYRWTGVRKDSVRINTTPVKSPHFLDTTSVLGTQYYFAVTAVDRAGNESVHSTRIQVFPTDTIPPGKPRGLTAVVDKRTVLLNWSAPPDRDIRGYKVSRGFLGGEKQFNLIEKPEAILKFLDKGDKERLEPGRRYCYAVLAVDSVWLQGDTAMACAFIPDNDPPLRPGAVLAENEFGRAVKVKWNSSPSLDVEKYRVVRKEGGNTLELGLFPADNRDLRDTAVQKNKTYSYEITAIDTSRNVSQATLSQPVAVRDYQAPPKPRFAAASYDGKKILVRWERVVDFDLAGYNVYRSKLPTGSPEKINKQPVRELRFEDASGKKGFWYRIRALDASGNESQPSDPVTPQ